MCAINYDYFKLPLEMMKKIKDDYHLIRKLIIERQITQKGQKYLHVHPHGNKGSKTRALGFKH